jgi:hypothetical protein
MDYALHCISYTNPQAMLRHVTVAAVKDDRRSPILSRGNGFQILYRYSSLPWIATIARWQIDRRSDSAGQHGPDGLAPRKARIQSIRLPYQVRLTWVAR